MNKKRKKKFLVVLISVLVLLGILAIILIVINYKNVLLAPLAEEGCKKKWTADLRSEGNGMETKIIDIGHVCNYRMGWNNQECFDACKSDSSVQALWPSAEEKAIAECKNGKIPPDLYPSDPTKFCEKTNLNGNYVCKLFLITPCKDCQVREGYKDIVGYCRSEDLKCHCYARATAVGYCDWKCVKYTSASQPTQPPTQPVSCTDDCSPSGAKICSLNGAQTCGNYDGDSCLEWSRPLSCGTYGCGSGGECAPPSVVE